MGFNVNEGYYEKHVNKKGYKITDEQQKINALDVNEIREGINIAQQQYAKDHNIELTNTKARTKTKEKEPIEYVIENREQQTKQIDEQER